MQSFKVGAPGHLRSFGPPVFWLPVGVGLLAIAIDLFSPAGLIAMCIGVAFAYAPACLLYLQYLYYNLGRMFRVDKLNWTISMTGWGRNVRFQFSQLLSVERVCSWAEHNPVKFMATDSCFYYRLDFDTGDKIIVTSLMVEQLPFLNVPTEEVKTIVPFVFPIHLVIRW